MSDWNSIQSESLISKSENDEENQNESNLLSTENVNSIIGEMIQEKMKFHFHQFQSSQKAMFDEIQALKTENEELKNQLENQNLVIESLEVMVEERLLLSEQKRKDSNGNIESIVAMDSPQITSEAPAEKVTSEPTLSKDLERRNQLKLLRKKRQKELEAANKVVDKEGNEIPAELGAGHLYSHTDTRKPMTGG